MPITFNSDGGFLAGTISASGNNLFIQTSGSAGIVHLDGDKVLLQSQSSGTKITASLRIENENLVINDNLKVKKDEFRFKSADRAKEVTMDVSADGDIRFKDNDNREIVRFREGGRIDLGQNDTATSQSITNWNGAISASGFVKCKNTFLGHNFGFPNSFILGHSDRVQNEDFSVEAGRGFAVAQNPGGYTYINAGDGENAGYESINFYQAGQASSILGKNRNWQFGAPDSVQFEPPEKVTVEGNISASGNLIIQGSITATSITSSIVTSSILQTEGSNIFGDTTADTHTFNGRISTTSHITASGNISSSGTITTNTLTVNGTTSFNDHITILQNKELRFDSSDTFIKADTDNPEDLEIHADDDIMINPDDDLFIQRAGSTYASFNGGGKSFGVGFINQNPQSRIHAAGDIFASGSSTHRDGHITASGNIKADGDISASGTIHGGIYNSFGNVLGTYHAGTDAIKLANSSDKTELRGTNITISGPVTASGDISASGVIYAKQIQHTYHQFDNPSNDSVNYIPAPGAYVIEGTSINYYRQWLAPYKGKIKKIVIYAENDCGTTRVSLYQNGIFSGYAEESLGATTAVVFDDFTGGLSGNPNFNQHDRIAIGMDPANTPGEVNLVCSWEYEIDS